MKKFEPKKWIGLFIIGIMVLSSVAIGVVDFFARPKGYSYNGISFTQSSNGFSAKINGQKMQFLLLPSDVENIDLPAEALSLLSSPVLMFSYDSNSNLSEYFADAQYYFESQIKDKSVIRGLVDPSGTSLPELSCINATSTQPVIVLKEGDGNISVEDSCIVLSAVDALDGYKMTERLVYHVLGVIR